MENIYKFFAWRWFIKSFIFDDFSIHQPGQKILRSWGFKLAVKLNFTWKDSKVGGHAYFWDDECHYDTGLEIRLSNPCLRAI